MRSHSLLSGLLGWILAAGTAVAADNANGPSTPLCVMTYNLRYASQTPPNAWPQRRPLVKACIERVRPDVLGTQEGVYMQLKDVATDLPDYDWIGLGRDGGSRGEFMAVFYRRDRLDPLEYDHFWLSDTPLVMGSATWGHTNRRMVTWVRFKDRKDGIEFYFWNTHLDHAVQPAREKGAALIRERVAALKTKLPVLLVGDFNAEAGTNPAYHTLVGEGAFTDTWFQAKERRNEQMNSFNGFAQPKQAGVRIDWILGRGVAEVSATEIVTYAEAGQFPSDHFPVVAWLTLARPQ